MYRALADAIRDAEAQGKSLSEVALEAERHQACVLAIDVAHLHREVAEASGAARGGRRAV